MARSVKEGKASSPVHILTAGKQEPMSPAWGESKTNKYMMIVFNTVDSARERLQKIKDLKTLEEIRFFAFRKDKTEIIKLVDARIKAVKNS